jgi:hypothetical protein
MCFKLFDNDIFTQSSILSQPLFVVLVDAASHAVRRNDLQRAVELEEQDRSQQWSLASSLRTPLDDRSPQVCR